MRRCDKCKWWKTHHDVCGDCRKNSPVLREPGAVCKINSQWPSTHPDSWCGEFKEQTNSHEARIERLEAKP